MRACSALRKDDGRELVLAIQHGRRFVINLPAGDEESNRHVLFLAFRRPDDIVDAQARSISPKTE